MARSSPRTGRGRYRSGGPARRAGARRGPRGLLAALRVPGRAAPSRLADRGRGGANDPDGEDRRRAATLPRAIGRRMAANAASHDTSGAGEGRVTAAARWRETRRTALAIARRVHHYGDPPDPRLQEDVDGDIWDIEDRLREAELALIEA